VLKHEMALGFKSSQNKERMGQKADNICTKFNRLILQSHVEHESFILFQNMGFPNL
jgi:hypothetical protein